MGLEVRPLLRNRFRRWGVGDDSVTGWSEVENMSTFILFISAVSFFYFVLRYINAGAKEK